MVGGRMYVFLYVHILTLYKSTTQRKGADGSANKDGDADL